MTKTCTKPLMSGISAPSMTARKRALKAGEEVVLGKKAKFSNKTYVVPAAPSRSSPAYTVYDKTMEGLIVKHKVNTFAMFGAILLAAIDAVEFDEIYTKAARKLGWRYNTERQTILFNAVNRLINEGHLRVVDKHLLLAAPTAVGLVCISGFIKFKSKKR